jgi:anti-sigma B factor antagonist
MDVSVIAGRVSVALRGEIDMATAPDLEERASLLLRKPIDRLTLDMGGVSTVDSVGIGALVRISQQAHALDCTFALVDVPDLLRRVLEVTGLTAALNVQPRTPTVADGSG